MPDSFQHHQSALDAPAFNASAVTPNDGADLGATARALFIGVGGDVAAILKGDATSVVFKNVPQGTVLPVSAKRVLATGTTATNIVALW
jgi:hypothetical protein